MKVLTEKANLFNKAIGEQAYNTDGEYRFFTYVVRYEYKDVVLLFNTLSRQQIFLEKQEYDEVKNNIRNNLFERLVKDYFLVPVNYNDLKLKEQIVTISYALSAKKGFSTYTIMPTMDCNARCFYCFEHGMRRYPMTDKTAEDVSKFILKKSSNDEIKILWFGGEPLYNIQAINIITDRLISANKPFKSTMISNGYLFDKETVKLAKDKWNLKSVQITLDGTEEIYNRCKAYIYKTDQSPFYRVLNNIGYLLENRISVNVRINMDKHNKDDLFKLVDILHERFAKYDTLFFVYAWLLYDNRGAVKSIRSDIERHMLTNDLIALEEYIYSKGLGAKSTPKREIRLGACQADNDNGTTILPDGHLGKCDHHSDDEFWGSIYSDQVDYDVIKSWKEKREPVELCKTCPLVPQCNHLKKCPDDGAYDCDEYVQAHRLSKLHRQMKNAYDKYLSEMGTV